MRTSELGVSTQSGHSSAPRVHFAKVAKRRQHFHKAKAGEPGVGRRRDRGNENVRECLESRSLSLLSIEYEKWESSLEGALGS